MKKECLCIMIDDNPSFRDSATISNLKERILRDHSIILNFEQLNPLEDNFLNENDGSINILLIEKALDSQKYLKRQVDLIICDYNFGDEAINGFEICRILRNNLNSKKKIILYTSNLDDVINKILDTGSQEEKRERIRDLVKAEISDFCIRENHLPESIIKILIDETSFSADKFIEQELYRYKDLTFKNIYHKFEGMQLGEIAEIISKQKHEGEHLKKEILEQVIAYMIELAND